MQSLFNNIYKGKKVLITGHTGFKGSWLSIWLNELGAEVAGLSLDPQNTDDNFVLSGLSTKLIDIRGNVKDYNAVLSAFTKFSPDIVFHLAAQPLVVLSYEYPKETFDTNTGGTVNVLEAIRHTPSIKVAVMITTDKCYENHEMIWGYRENDAMGGYDPYSASKGAAEIVISGYRNSFFNPSKFESHGVSVSSARAGNVIGGGDWAKDRIIPDCIRSIKNNEPIKVRSPFATRPWQHVLEPLSSYLWLGSQMWEHNVRYSGAWNFGPDYESVVPVKKIVELLIKYMKMGEWIDTSTPDAPHEAKLLALDCTKAKSFLNLYPILDIEQNIMLTAEWYLRYENENVYDLCVQNINYFIGRASQKKAVWIK